MDRRFCSVMDGGCGRPKNGGVFVVGLRGYSESDLMVVVAVMVVGLIVSAE